MSLSSSELNVASTSNVEEIDYESLPSHSSMAVHMLAGAAAGISEHTFMFPVDSIKTRMQILTASPAGAYTGVSHAFMRITSTEGFRSLWRGVASVVAGAGPAHALYFGMYEFVKDQAGGNKEGHQFIATSLGGAAATLASDAFMNPFDVIKQRMQMQGSIHANVLTAARTVYRTEGLSAFYVSYPTTLSITVPFNAIQFSAYEYFKKVLNPSESYSPLTHIAAGGLAGGIAGAVTTPLDVAKTLLQTRGNSTDARIRNCSGMVNAMKIIGERHGWRGFLRGMSPRVIANVPSTALCWATYEAFKKFISNKDGTLAPIT